ncbi:MAG: lactamase [Anaerolineales bacterium]|nr:lactamase [Anaerolineales bacterium]
MEIVWHGLSCFRLSERNLASVVTDPYSPEIGLPALKLKADIVTVSHDAPGHNNVKAVKGVRRQISGPGEYEIGGVFIIGILMVPKNKKKASGRPNMLFVFDFDGLTVAHLGDLAYVPSQAQIEDLGTVDVALVPVGGGSALSPSQAAEVISLIEPSIVVPMHYKTGKMELKLGTVKRFLSEMGITKQEPLPSLKVTKSGLSEETQVVILEPRM